MLNSQCKLLAAALILGAGTWYYLFCVFLPFRDTHQPPGMNTQYRYDLYPPWIGAREFLLHKQDPYSAAVTQTIQRGYYGRLPGPDAKAGDEQRFAYPLYLVFFLAPTVKLSFHAVNVGFALFLSVLATASVYLWAAALVPGLTRSEKLLCILFTMGSWPIAEGIQTRQLTLLAAFLVAWAIFLIVRGHFVSAGLCLACALIKPQLTFLADVWLLLWAAGDWKKRQALVWSFAGGAAALWLGADLALPHWFQRWSAVVPAYLAYTGSKPSVIRLFGLVPGLVLTILVVLAVAWLCWKLRALSGESRAFSFLCCLVLAATLAVMPAASLASYNQMLLIPVVIWGYGHRREIFSSPLQALAVGTAAVALAWQFLADLGIAVANTFPGFAANESILRIPLYCFFVMPPLVMAALAMLAPTYTRQAAPFPPESQRQAN